MQKSLSFFLIFWMSIGCLFAADLPKSNIDSVPENIIRYDKFQESKIISCAPKGWLLEFLNRQRSGLTGHPEALSYPFNTCLWAGIIKRPDDHGDTWWPYEQTAYYSDGLLRLGYLLKDSNLIRKGRAGIDFILGHPQKNGRLGLEFNTNQWPFAVYFRVLQAEYLATGKQSIIDALQKHYLSYRAEQIGKEGRSIVNIEGVLWTYGKTKDPKLLELAENAYSFGGFELNLQSCLSQDKIVIHGVTYMEEAKLPAILYAYTGKKKYLEAAINAIKKLDRDHVLPDGVPSSNEFLAGKDPLQSHETCDISDYTWTLGYLLMATGDAIWADHIEKAIFNAGLGAVSKDFKTFQYFSSVNQFIATGNSNNNKNTAYGSNWMEYRPCHAVECCAGNVNRFMPNYVARMWMRDNNGGPVAALYGPSVEKVSFNGDKQNFTITEKTNYPFSDKIVFTFNMTQPLTFPFSFRIPAWCLKASIMINDKEYSGDLISGTFVTLKRTFRKGDKIVVRLPMPLKLVKWENFGMAVERGPLLFAYAISEYVTIDTVTYLNLNGKKSLLPNFPALDIRPASSWNYALAVDEKKFARQIKVMETGKLGYPFDPATVPIVMTVPVKKIKNWTLLDNRYTPSLPGKDKFEFEDVADSTISLVPYGSTRLRISVFPVSNSYTSQPISKN